MSCPDIRDHGEESEKRFAPAAGVTQAKALVVTIVAYNVVVGPLHALECVQDSEKEARLLLRV